MPPVPLRALAAAALTLLAAGGCARPAGGDVRLTVSAASSLREATAELAERFEAEHPGVDVRVNLGASGSLARQIEQGARVDLFVSAAAGPMDALAERGLVDTAARAPFAGNRLVLVVPAGDTATRGFRDLASPRVRRVALGAPASVPAGEYAAQTLRALGIADRVEPKAVYAQNVRQVLAYVESGNVDAGVVYATDAATSGRVRVAAEAPPGSHRPIVYPLAVVRATAHPREARALAGYLLGPEARVVLRRRGFSTPAP
ncbi:MAG TPA: molybdate ABC transporter substrate-binding protein [Longimicrobiaceae bacterium]|nr:molybdate ABC transporter substrate-binding protein [Longimicrobiaceae bacterium]